MYTFGVKKEENSDKINLRYKVRRFNWDQDKIEVHGILGLEGPKTAWSNEAGCR